MTARAAAAILALSALALGGCVERRMHITTDPPGARVWLNDSDVGLSPVEVDFEWYGTYDVRLTLDGYEPVATTAKADAPPHEWPGLDIVAMALPVRFDNEVRWHFVLEPADDDPDAMIERGRAFRAEHAHPAPAAPPATDEHAPE